MARKQPEIQGKMMNHLNVELFYQTLARLVGEQHGVEITVTVTPKESEKQDGTEKSA